MLFCAREPQSHAASRDEIPHFGHFIPHFGLETAHFGHELSQFGFEIPQIGFRKSKRVY